MAILNEINLAFKPNLFIIYINLKFIYRIISVCFNKAFGHNHLETVGTQFFNEMMSAAALTIDEGARIGRLDSYLRAGNNVFLIYGLTSLAFICMFSHVR